MMRAHTHKDSAGTPRAERAPRGCPVTRTGQEGDPYLSGAGDRTGAERTLDGAAEVDAAECIEAPSPRYAFTP